MRCRSLAGQTVHLLPAGLLLLLFAVVDATAVEALDRPGIQDGGD